MPHPPETVFRYLVDPRNRPEWQASLLSVTLRDRGEPTVPTTIAYERATNPFMRAHDADELARLRAAKDSF